MTALGNIQFAGLLHDVGGAERKRRAAELLDLVGLAPHAAKYPHQLQGQQQRVFGLHRPSGLKIPLLDEPLSALDAKGGAGICGTRSAASRASWASPPCS